MEQSYQDCAQAKPCTLYTAKTGFETIDYSRMGDTYLLLVRIRYACVRPCTVLAIVVVRSYIIVHGNSCRRETGVVPVPLPVGQNQ
jgi:hypothetical protein